MNKQAQRLILAKMLCSSKRGLTSVDIQKKLGTTCPHKRVSDVKKLGTYKVIKIDTDRDGCRFAYRAEPIV